jgi:hypothetical protein
MNNVQNCDIHINTRSSQTYKTFFFHSDKNCRANKYQSNNYKLNSIRSTSVSCAEAWRSNTWTGYSCAVSRDISQAISRNGIVVRSIAFVLTYYRTFQQRAAGRVRGHARTCGICGGQSSTGAGFFQLHRCPLPIFPQTGHGVAQWLMLQTGR